MLSWIPPSQHETPPFLLARFTIIQPLPLDDQTLTSKRPSRLSLPSCSPELQCIEGTKSGTVHSHELLRGRLMGRAIYRPSRGDSLTRSTL